MLLRGLPAAALDPDRRISQYAHSAWRVRDGAFAGSPTAIAQTTDGYIWIGTFAGLLRFDGVRFVPFVPPAGKHLPNPAVISILGATDGSLWIGTANGLAQLKNEELLTFPEIAGRVNSILEDLDGTIWIARSRTDAGGVCKIAASIASCYAPKDGVPPNAQMLIRDNLGFFLIAHSTGITRWKPGSSTSFELPVLKSAQGLNGISDLALAPDGSVWVGTSGEGPELGLKQWINGAWKAFTVPALDTSKLRVNDLKLDRHNALWIATDGTGIYRVHDGNVDHFASADGLSNDSVQNFFEDREGNLWLTTTAGVDCFRGTPVVTFSEHEGLTADKVGSILAARDGTVWIGNHAALDFVRGRVVSFLGPKQGFRGNRVTSLFEDQTGRLWVGEDNGLLVYEHGRFTPVQRPDGGPFGIVLAMTEDTDHNVWASVIRNPPGRPTRLICFRDGKFVKEISDQKLDIVSLAADPQGGFWLGLIQGGLAQYRNDQVQVFPLKDTTARVNQVLANFDGSVLAATDHGLVERRGDSQHTLDDKTGLPCNRIYALVLDKHSDLWLYAECGLIKVKSDDLQRWREHPEQKVKFDLFDAFDGAQPFLPPFRPIATRSSDGRLWFANDTVAQMIDPDGPLRNPIPPPVHIEDVLADRKTYSPQGGLRLPALTRDLEIDYTALSFVVPQKVHFQYELEGYDRDWQDAGTRRQAFYSNLPPRSYTFRVKACNNSGVWNEAGASFDFSVAPAYYQTNWFRFFCVAAGIALLWALHRWRVHQLKSQEEGLREAVETIPALTFTTLPDGSNTFVNKRWTEYTGLSVEKTLGTGWQRAIYPDDLVRHSKKWHISVATGQVFEDEARFRRAADGEYRWFLVRGVPLRDQHGKIVRWYGTLTDIEDRKRAEKALEQSQMYLTEGQRVAHMGSWAFNAAGFEYWSSELFRIHGLDPSGKPPTVEEYLALVYPEDRAFIEQGIAKMLDDHLAFDFTKRIVWPDGEIRHVRCVGVPVMRGRIFQGFLGTGVDVTEEELLTRELERRQAHLAEAQRLTHTGSWTINIRTDEHFWSEEIFRIYEFDPNVTPAWSLIRDRVHPDDRASLDQRKKMEFTQTGWTDSEADLRIVLPDGRIKHLHTIAHPVMDASGQIVEVIGTTMDVTERKRIEDSMRRSEGHLAEAQKLTHTGSWAWGVADRKAVHLSEEWYRIYGFDPAEGAPRWEEYFERVHPEDRLTLKVIIERAVVEKADYDQEFRILLPNGILKWIHTVGHPVLSNAGDLEGFAGSSTDITELKSAEQERERLRQLEADLAHTNRVSVLGEMAASLAHEIKQPIAAAMTSANSCIEWLAHEPPNLDRARAAAAKIDKYGNRAAEIIDHIRSLYRKSPPQSELIDVNEIVCEIFTLLQGEAIRYSIVMRSELAGEQPKIKADRVQLQQVFMNLMLNGIEAMSDEGGDLTVKSQRQDGQLLFSVSDTGPGLPADNLDQIFSAFFTTKPQGSGMGLAISRSIVESHGGRLWATANDGRGATFHFTLPTEVT
jgi:PAS domain S-box-containing protein